MKHYVLISVCFLIALSCKKDPAGPPPDVVKDPRNYTWTVDTLEHPESFQTMMTRIWGSSPNNLYVVGHNGLGKRMMYRYNGQHWQPVPISQTEGGPIERPNLTDIYGITPSNIYVVGWRAVGNPNPSPQALWASLVICFDGSRWNEIPSTGSYLQCIAGNSSGLTYTAGQGNIGFVLNGIAAQPDTIPVTWPLGASFGVGSVTVTPSGEVYANAAWRQDFDTKFYFLRRSSNSQWRIIDTALVQPGLVESKWGYGKLWYSPWGILYSTYGDVWIWNGSGWNTILEGNTFLTDIKGSSASDLFVCGHFGLLYHFNGQDWYQFQQLADYDLVFTALLVFENELFLLGHQAGGYRTYVFHGK